MLTLHLAENGRSTSYPHQLSVGQHKSVEKDATDLFDS